MSTFQELLEKSIAEHDHLCPRQILGVRTGLYAAELLGFDLPQKDKRLLVISETYGCYVDGVSAASGCAVGHRTMFIKDFGKIATTFVDKEGGTVVRIFPQIDVREKVRFYASDNENAWLCYIEAYQKMPDDELFVVQNVELCEAIQKIISYESARAICHQCGEEIFNEREVVRDGQSFCRSCAGQAYYTLPFVTVDSRISIAESGGF